MNGLYKRKHFDVLAGFRWISLQESLQFNVQSSSIPGFSEPASFFNAQDQFKTTNNFIGPQLGVQGHLGNHHWGVDASIKGGVGAMIEHANVRGTSLSPGGNLFISFWQMNLSTLMEGYSLSLQILGHTTKCDLRVF